MKMLILWKQSRKLAKNLSETGQKPPGVASICKMQSVARRKQFRLVTGRLKRVLQISDREITAFRRFFSWKFCCLRNMVLGKATQLSDGLCKSIFVEPLSKNAA